MKKINATSVKTFVSQHKTKIAVVATVAVCYVIHRSAVESWNEFLDEKGLTSEYYLPEE